MKATCVHCDARIYAGDPFCPTCERPTPWASQEERTRWEVAQWRAFSTAPTREVHVPAIAARPRSAPQRRLEPAPAPAPVPRRWNVRAPVDTVIVLPEVGPPRTEIHAVPAEPAAPPHAEGADALLREAIALLREMNVRIGAIERHIAAVPPSRAHRARLLSRALWPR
jgi:hypothetical protein